MERKVISQLAGFGRGLWRVGSWSGVTEEARRPWHECRCWDWGLCSCPSLWSWHVLLRKGKWGRSSARVWLETSPLVNICGGVQGLWVASLRSTQQPRPRRPGETTRWAWLQGLAWPHALTSPTACFLAVDMLMRPNGKGQLSWGHPTPKDLGRT